ncbi:hypothetical protein MTR67_031213 [Solanum verrucosum]|uniref:Uncharacterized protein n=1 Tax=Solanum verrucosum TaxID=315347 RepID=A0AAF0U212_SOLVR|nr:hypothetical protein MTR67_031213 [Solanum verrucosum]
MVVFEVVSGLKENWRKSRIFPIKEVTNIQSLASLLECEVGKVPTVHLGMPLSRKYRKGGPVIWAWDFHVGGLKFETPCQRKQGVAFWVELVAPGLPSAGYLSYVEVIVHKFGQNSPWCSNEVNCTYGMVRSKLQENSRIRVGNVLRLLCRNAGLPGLGSQLQKALKLLGGGKSS